MKYTLLGNSDLNVSRICMGCMGFGDATKGQHSWTIDEEHSREIIKRGLDLGVNFFDTAIAYQLGTSEQYVGRALRDMAKRDDVVVATKFLPRSPIRAEPVNNTWDVRSATSPEEKMWSWPRNSCREHLRKSKMVFPDSSILRT